MTRNLSGIKPPRIVWEKIKNKILSPRYELSLVFVGERLMNKLKKFKRGVQTGSSNVLSFVYEPKRGEIFLNFGLIRRQSKNAGMSFKKYALFLYVHALLHLRGFGHNTKRDEKIMTKEEQKWLKMLS